MKPTLFLLAAGMGSRYGGLKQLDGLGPNGETIMVHLHRYFNFTGSLVETAPKSLHLSCGSELTRQGTFSSVAKIDLNVEKDFSAWQITSINGTTITFEEVTSVAPASTGLLLKGTADNVAVLTVTDADETTLLDNKLIGITTPTQVEAGSYYGLKGNTFVPVNAGTVPAGKALLPASYVSLNVKAYTFIFNDATGIQTVQTVSAEDAQAIFNLAGQRLPKAQKGINIINGKKVLIK